MHKALGRGLESLLPATNVLTAGGVKAENVMTISIDKVRPNRYQPRAEFNESKLRELAESIKQHGLAQPLLVTPSAIPGEYELIAGERRLRACRMAGLKEVQAILRNVEDKQRFHLSLIENLQREDLNPIEEAKAYTRLCDEFDYRQEDIAKVVGKDRSVVANAMRLLNLPAEIQEAIMMGIISAGHGRILAGIDDSEKQKLLAERINSEKLTVRDIENIIGGFKALGKDSKKKSKKIDAELIKLGEELQRIFGTKIKFAGKPQKGKIEIHYFSLKELDRIIAILKSKRRK